MLLDVTRRRRPVDRPQDRAGHRRRPRSSSSRSSRRSSCRAGTRTSRAAASAWYIAICRAVLRRDALAPCSSSARRRSEAGRQPTAPDDDRELDDAGDSPRRRRGGDPAAGKAVFTSAGCASCHTLKDAGSTGNVGPNLDQLKPAVAAVKHQVENGGGAMPAFKGTADAPSRSTTSRRTSSASTASYVKTAPEMTKPARGRGGIRRSHVSSPDSVMGEPARRILQDEALGRGIAQKGDFAVTRSRESGEGGIRTLEAGISPPNALAGRRLQPLGHFSGGAHRTAALSTRKPARGGLSGKRRERDLNPRCTFQHIRDFQSRSLDRSDTPPRGRAERSRGTARSPHLACGLRAVRVHCGGGLVRLPVGGVCGLELAGRARLVAGRQEDGPVPAPCPFAVTWSMMSARSSGTSAGRRPAGRVHPGDGRRPGRALSSLTQVRPLLGHDGLDIATRRRGRGRAPPVGRRRVADDRGETASSVALCVGEVLVRDQDDEREQQTEQRGDHAGICDETSVIAGTNLRASQTRNNTRAPKGRRITPP